MDSSETKLKSNKKWKRRKFLRCFRPVDTDGFVRPKVNGSEGDDHEYFKYIAVGRKESAVFPAEMSPMVSTCVSSEEDEDDEEDGVPRPEKIGASRRISRALKAVLRDASMAKNIGKRRLLPQKSSNSLINESSRYREMEINDARRIRRVASSLSTSSYSSQASSLMMNNNNNNNNNSARITTERIRSFGSNSFVWKQNNVKNDDNVEEDQAKKKLCYASNTGMCLVALSLLVLITWGKMFAIFCTSTWLFFMPFWAKKDNQTPVAKPSEMDSAEYKKRVVMEGFLARDRTGSFNGRLL